MQLMADVSRPWSLNDFGAVTHQIRGSSSDRCQNCPRKRRIIGVFLKFVIARVQSGDCGPGTGRAVLAALTVHVLGLHFLCPSGIAQSYRSCCYSSQKQCRSIHRHNDARNKPTYAGTDITQAMCALIIPLLPPAAAGAGYKRGKISRPLQSKGRNHP